MIRLLNVLVVPQPARTAATPITSKRREIFFMVGWGRGTRDSDVNSAVAWADRLRELRKPGIGFDRDPVPALQIKGERHVVEDRMAGPDIDIEAVIALAQAAQQMKILETLRIGERVHGRGPFRATGLAGIEPGP